MDVIILKAFKVGLIGFSCFFIMLSNRELERELTEELERPDTYKQEEIYFENKNAGFKLAGTLMYPKKAGQFGAVTLISGLGHRIAVRTDNRNPL